MVKWIVIAILLLPIAETAAIVSVAAIIGLPWALAFMVLTTLSGFLVLRRAGRGRIARFRVAVADTDITAIEANTDGFLTVLAGLLLFLPGFLTDLVGAAMLFAPVRRRVTRVFRRWVDDRQHRDRSFIDLAPGEWQQVTDDDSRNATGKPDGR